jgi:valyl-tRNA synthetase
MPLLERFTADGLRYWAASARLGADATADDKVFKIGKRLQTKIFNASKFVLSQTAEVHPVSAELDRAFLAGLRHVVQRATDSFERFNHAQALQETESFFWNHLTDTYLEIAKMRARDEADPVARGSAVATLRLGLSVLLRLFAPVLPYITEEVWSWIFAEETGCDSIHRAPWPGEADFRQVPMPEHPGSFEIAAACWRAINKAKADASVSMGREVERLEILANATTLEGLGPGLTDVLLAARCRAHDLVENPSLGDGVFEIGGAVFAERAGSSGA